MVQKMPIVRYRPNGVREILGEAEVDFEVEPQGNPPKLFANLHVSEDIKKQYEGLVGSFKLKHRTIESGRFIVNTEPEIVWEGLHEPEKKRGE